MKKKNAFAIHLGQKIRHLRRLKKVTLIELSEATHIAQATLSRIETGLMVGTAQSHQKIAETLGVSLGELYQQIDTRLEKTKYHAAAEPKKVMAKNSEMTCELLTQEISKKKITPLLITLTAHGKSQSEHLERGVEIFAYALSGTVKVQLDKDEYSLNEGDTLYFDGSIPHQFINTASKQAKILCAVSPSKI